MGNPRGIPRDFDALEARRMNGLALMRRGLNNSEIGRELGVANQTVSRWRKEYRQGGKKALAQAGRAGRRRYWIPSRPKSSGRNCSWVPNNLVMKHRFG